MNNTPAPFLVDELLPAHRSWRVAMVTESYPPEVNGVANTVARVVDGLRQRDHAVQLIRPRQDRADEASTEGNFHEVLTRGMAIPMYSHLRMGLPSKQSLVNLWTARRPDMVHIATEGPLGWSALQAAIKLRLPVCSDFRTNFHAYSQFYGMAWLGKPIMGYLRKFHNRCHATMVPTQALRQTLEQQGFQSMSVVARGVDTQLFTPHKRSLMLRANWGVDNRDVVALHVGRLAPEKNLGVVVQAYAQMKQVQKRLRLVVVGDGPARAELAALCPDATFVGFQSGTSLAAHYASSDLFLFPSLTETYGNVTPEAMASGLAVVAFDDAAAGQLIKHRANGALAPKGDVAAFTRNAAELATDAALRARLGAQARQTAEGLSWSNVLQNIEEVYAKALARSEMPATSRNAPRNLMQPG